MSFIPDGVPADLLALIQQDKLAEKAMDTMFPYARYSMDFKREKLMPGMGTTMSIERISGVAPDLIASPAIGSVDALTFTSERMTAAPRNFAKKVNVDAPTSYAQTAGSRWLQSVSRLAMWMALTRGRSARQALFQNALAGFAMVRRTQAITTDSVILVNQLKGFRYVMVNGIPTAVSSTNPLPITIVAVTTFTALVTGTTPIDPNFPDGPGQLTLSVGLSAALVEGSYVYVTSAAPYIVRPAARVSSDTLLSTDLPVMANIRAMKAKLVDQGVPVHPSTGSYHMHVGPSFFDKIGADEAYRQATQGLGAPSQLGPGAFLVPGLGITFIENSDSPAQGKTDGSLIQQVGSSGFTVGATGTPGSSQTMIEIGADVRNKAGVKVERGIMTGDEVGSEWFVDEAEYITLNGGVKIGEISGSISAYLVNGMQILAGDVMGARMIIRPPLDDRMLISTVTMSSTFDFLVHSDVNCLADTSDLRPNKRSVVLEYGVPGLSI